MMVKKSIRTFRDQLLVVSMCMTLVSCVNDQKKIAPKPSPYSTKTTAQKPSLEHLNPKERRQKKQQLVQEKHKRLNYAGKQLKELSLDELRQAKIAFLEQGETLTALKYLERLLVVA